MKLADARARIPELAAIEADPAADRIRLEQIADDCDRFTPLIAVEPPDGLVLDMTGCLHAFDTEAKSLAAVEERLFSWVSDPRLAMASTPEGARALARFSSVGAADEAASLRGLPVAALELEPETEKGLRRAGLKTVGDLADRPAAPLAARFGTALIDRLDRVLGRSDSRITPRRTDPALALQRRFAEPIGTADAAMTVLDALARETTLALEARSRGGRRFLARFYRSDGHIVGLAVESSLPLRDPVRIRQLFDERMGALVDPIDPGFGFDMISLDVLHDEPLGAMQFALEGEEAGEEAVTALIDRLSTRVGRQRIRRFVAYDSHIPEQAASALPAIETTVPTTCPPPEPGEPPLRPIHLFAQPQPVEVIAGFPDDPPRRFRWHDVLYDVARAEGPERIGAEWWRRAPGDAGLTRDYYRVEVVSGRRFWLFRHGLYGKERADPCWYVHGLFA